jgi:hypothetical protein
MVNDYNRMLLKITRLEQSNDWLVNGKNPSKLYAKVSLYWGNGRQTTTIGNIHFVSPCWKLFMASP